MWFLVQVVKGSKHFDVESQIGNRVMISDSSEMVISGRSMGAEGYRFEARKGKRTSYYKTSLALNPRPLSLPSSSHWRNRLGLLSLVARPSPTRKLRPNPSIERTPNSQLRCLSVSAHVKR